MKTIYIFALALTAMPLMARETALPEFVESYNQRYTSEGVDNNDLATREVRDAASYPNAREVSGKELVAALNDCVFIQEGAYGQHMDKITQEKLALDFVQDLEALFILTPTLYRVESVSLDFGTPNHCAVILDSKLGHEALLVQGLFHD